MSHIPKCGYCCLKSDYPNNIKNDDNNHKIRNPNSKKKKTLVEKIQMITSEITDEEFIILMIMIISKGDYTKQFMNSLAASR